MKITRNTQIARAEGPVQTTIGSEVVLMVLATGKCIGLGETGSDVWRLLEHPTTVQPLVAALLQQYDAAPEVIEADVLELLDRLHQEGLITLS